jgi:hypothetical protein
LLQCSYEYFAYIRQGFTKISAQPEIAADRHEQEQLDVMLLMRRKSAILGLQSNPNSAWAHFEPRQGKATRFAMAMVAANRPHSVIE